MLILEPKLFKMESFKDIENVWVSGSPSETNAEQALQGGNAIKLRRFILLSLGEGLRMRYLKSLT